MLYLLGLELMLELLLGNLGLELELGNLGLELLLGNLSCLLEWTLRLEVVEGLDLEMDAC